MKHGPWEGVFQGGTGCLWEPAGPSLPDLLADLDEAGFSGVVRNKMQVKRGLCFYRGQAWGPFSCMLGDRTMLCWLCDYIQFCFRCYSPGRAYWPWDVNRAWQTPSWMGENSTRWSRSWARWLTLPHSFAITQLAFFFQSKVFFHILSVIFFFVLLFYLFFSPLQ